MQDNNKTNKKRPKKKRIIRKMHIRLGIVVSVLIIILFAIFTTISLGIKQVSKVVDLNEKEYNPSKWIEDIDYLSLKLIQNHPEPFKYIDQKVWNEEVEKLKSDIPRLNDEYVKMRISQLLSKLEDNNTNINEYLDEYIKVNTNYPIYVEKFGDEIRVVETDKAYSNILGAKLLSINNVPIDDILNSINTLIPNDFENNIITFRELDLIRSHNILKYFNIVSKENSLWKFEDDKKNIIELDLLNTTIYKKSDEVRVEKKQKEAPEYEELNICKYIKEDKIVYLKYDDLIESYINKATDATSYEEIEVFLKDIIRNIIYKNAEKIVIDIRENSYNRDDILRKFIDILNENEARLKNTQFFVITSNETKTHSILNVIDLKEELGAIIVGEETGRVHYFESPTNITLPNSQMKISCSTVAIDSSVYENYPYYSEYEKGIEPNIKVNKSYKNYINGIDDCYEAIKNYKEPEETNNKED